MAAQIPQGHRVAFRLTTPVAVLGLVSLLFGALQVTVSLHRVATLEANTMDLGFVEQVLWKISHGDWWAYSTVFQTPALANDGCVWLYPLAYAFRYLGGPVVLFVVQALGTVSASWGLYRAARIHQLTGAAATSVAIAFLLYPAILGGSQFDFHPDFLALPAVIWAYVAYAERRMAASLLWLAAAALSKDVVLVSTFGWGLGLLVWRHRTRDGLLIMAGSAAWMGLEFLWIIPTYLAHGTEAINFGLYRYLGDSVPGILTGLVTHFPALATHILAERNYFIWIFGPVLGLVLAGSASVPAFLAFFAMNAASTFGAQHKIADQYQVILAAWAFLAVIEALARWPRWQGRLAAAVTLTTALFEGVFFVGYIVPLWVPVGPAYYAAGRPHPAATVAAAVQVASEISPNSVVWTTNHLGYLTYRSTVMGVALEVVPGVMVDSLPDLWREGEARGLHETTIFAERPVRPYLAAVMGQAVAAGYRVTQHRSGFVLLTGIRHFRPVHPAAFGLGWEPQGGSWSIPAWTQQSAVGVVDWDTSSPTLVARRGHAGEVLGPLLLELPRGTYGIRLGLDSPPTRGPLGRWAVGPVTAVVRTDDASDVITMTVPRAELAIVSVQTSGRVRWVLQAIHVSRRSDAPTRKL